MMNVSGVEIVLTAGVIGAIVGAVLILVAARRDDDRGGRRTPARYVALACFLSVFVTLFASFMVVGSLTQFIVDGDAQIEVDAGFDEFGGPGAFDEFGVAPGEFEVFAGPPNEPARPSDDSLWRSAVQAGLVAIVAAGIFVFHRNQRNRVRASVAEDAAVTRVDRTYVYVVCFVAVAVVLVAASAGVYGVFRAIAPGVTSAIGGDIERQRGIADAISLAFLGAGSALVFLMHWRDRDQIPAVSSSPDLPVA